MTNITPSDIYWVMQADSIRGVLEGAIFFYVFILIFAVSSLGVFWAELEEKRMLRRLIAATAFALAALFASSVGIALMPDTQSLAAIKLFPAIADSDEIAVEAPELHRLAVDALKRAAGEQGDL